MEPEEVELDVASVIVATGFDMEDAAKKETYGYGVYPNVFTSLEFERLVASTGPTDGEIVRRSDDAHPREIAFIQCVCSRDVQSNQYCSAFCCMASVKEAILAKEHVPNVSCTVFYMDLRAFGKGYQEFYERASREFGVEFVRSRPAKIEEDPETGNLYVTYEDTMTTRLRKKEFDMVVLAVGVDPQPLELLTSIDSDGFASISEPYNDPAATQTEGIFVIGMAAEAQDVPDSVMQAGAAAMKAAIIASEGGAQDV
jgi:heterodisulfide reductase subunit A